MTVRERLDFALQNPLKAGYVTYTGHVMTGAECESYNRYTREAARPGLNEKARDFLLDQRHLFFVLISEK